MRFLVSILLFCSPLLCLAQGEEDRPVLPDTASTVLVTKEAGSQEFVMRKSPTLALVYGIIPGGGQFYTEQYWKIPLFAVPIGTLVGIGIYNHGLYRDYADQMKTLDPDGSAYQVAKQRRNTYQDRRDLSYGIGGVVFLLSLMDAYVGAHLFDFDVDDKLSSLYLYPDAEHNGVGLGVRW